MAKTFTWALPSGQSGAFASLASWLDITGGTPVPPAQTPAANDTIELGGGAVVSGSGTVDTLLLSGLAILDGTVDVAGASGADIASASTLDVAGSSGSLAVAGAVSVAGQMNITGGAAGAFGGPVTVGQSGGGTATLAVLSGAMLGTGPASVVDIGAAAAAAGAVLIDGAGTRLTAQYDVFLAKDGGTFGTMIVSNGASLQADTYLVVGYGGLGSLTIESGGVLRSLGPYSDIGFLGGSSGAAVIDGSGSLWSMAGQLWVGSGTGSGSLSLSNHAALNVTSAMPDLYPAIRIGDAAGAHGMVSVATGATLNAGAGSVAVGMQGSGTLTVQGGTVLASSAGYFDGEGALIVGWAVQGVPSITGTGMVTVDGPASLIQAAGEIAVGLYGSGLLSIANTGTVAMTGALANGRSAVDIGNDAAASGAVVVSGIGSLLAGGGGRIAVGNSGIGTLMVSQGGSVSASAALYSDIEPALRIGQSAGGSGAVTVEGNGSALSANGAAWVGQNGSGVLTVSTGGELTAGGVNDGGAGLVVNAGAGTGNVQVSAGTLDVSDNAQINGSGTVSVSGNGGLLRIGSSLTMQTGGTLAVDGSAAIEIGGSMDARAGLVMLDAGGTLSGAGLIAGALSDAGLLLASGGSLEIAGPVTGAATLHVGAGATLQLDGFVSNLSVAFDSAVSGTLALVAAAGTSITVDTLGAGDTFLVEEVPAGGGAPVMQALFGGGVGGQTAFSFSGSAGALAMAEQTACFATGTRIATSVGDIAVEDLQLGMQVELARAPGGLADIVWIGHRWVDCSQHPCPWDVWPVRVAAGAFGPGKPARTLWLSPDHAVFTGGVLIPVRYLLNGGSIAQAERAQVTYWHVELAHHAVLLAEGLPCESYLDSGNRAAFANGGQTLQLHPAFARAAWAAGGCAPLVLGGPRLTRAKARLIARLPGLGFALTDDPGISLHADDVRLAAPWYGPACRTALPAGAARLTLRGATACPADLDPASTDTRSLGAALLRLRLDGEEVALDDARFGEGWLAPETGLRWTTGTAHLDVRGKHAIEMKFGDWHRYLRPPSATADAALDVR